MLATVSEERRDPQNDPNDDDDDAHNEGMPSIQAVHRRVRGRKELDLDHRVLPHADEDLLAVGRHNHNYPLKIKVVKHLDPNDYELLYVNKSMRGRDLKALIKSVFELEDSFNVLIFYLMVTSTGIKRRMLTDRGRVAPILADFDEPAEKPAFDFANFVELSVAQGGSRVVVIRIFNLTIDHLKQQIEKYFEVKGTEYKILAAESELSPKIAVEQATLKDLCINGFQLYIERTLAATTVSRKPSVKQAPRMVKHVNSIDSDDFDVMLSYSWSTKDQVFDLHDALIETLPGIRVWVDRDEMNGNLNESMARGVLKSTVIITCLSESYLRSWNCNKEINFADENKKHLIPAYMFGSLSFDQIQELKHSQDLSAPFMITAGKLHSDFGLSRKGSVQFTECVKLITDELRILIPRFRSVSEQTDIVPAVYVPEDPIRKWTDPVDFTADLENYKEDFVEGTREWFGHEVQEWITKHDESHVMWVNGAAGTGKSLLSYYIVTHLPSTNFITSVYFFCRHNDDEKNDPAHVVKTLVWKLCEQFDSFRKYVDLVLTDDNDAVKGGRSTILKNPYRAFEQVIVDGLNNLEEQDLAKPLIITIDALDELNPKTRSVILRIIVELSPKLPKNVKLFVTGRPEKDIYDCLTSIGSFELEPTTAENMSDVRKVVVDRFKTIWGVQEPFSGHLLECLNRVVQKSEGVFIFVKVVCEYLSAGSVTPEEALAAIDGFSSGPDDVYEAIAKRVIRDVGLNVYQSVMGAILFVSEPLDLESLSILASTPLNDTVNLFDKMRSLLRIVDGDVAVIHKSVKDYFTTEQRCDPAYYIDSANANMLLATSCLDILASLLSENGSTILPKSFRSLEHSETFTANDSASAAAIGKYGKPMPGPKTSKIQRATLDLSNVSTVARYSIQNLVLHLDPLFLPPNIEDFMNKYGSEVLLHLAARSGGTNVALWLIQDRNTDIEAEDALGKSPLELAVENRQAEMAKLLIDNGADTESCDSVGWTPLHWATWNSQADLVKVILATKPNVNAVSKLDRTPLHIAGWHGNMEIVKMLIKAGANLEIREKEGKTPLIMAAEKGHLEVVTYLLDIGANIMAHGIWGQTSLHRASENGHLAVIKLLIKRNATVPITDFYGRTSVSTASFGGHKNVIQYLLENGASFDTVDAKGMTPLHEAAKQGHCDVVEFLLENGANVLTEDQEGRSPLYIAALGCYNDCLQILIKNGAKINEPNQYGEPPLFLAAMSGFLDVVQVLLEFGADVSVTNENGDTPLYVAASVGLKSIVEVLVQKGADVNSKTKSKDTPLQAALRGGHQEVAQLLRDYGAKEEMEYQEVGQEETPKVAPTHPNGEDGIQENVILKDIGKKKMKGPVRFGNSGESDSKKCVLM